MKRETKTKLKNRNKQKNTVMDRERKVENYSLKKYIKEKNEL